MNRDVTERPTIRSFLANFEAHISLMESDLEDEKFARALKGGADDDDTPMPFVRVFENQIAELRASLTALTAWEQQQGWQPIGTAPKDGTRVDLWLSFTDSDGQTDSWRAPWCRWYGEHWINTDGIYQADWPTHWSMPLPPPPREPQS